MTPHHLQNLWQKQFAGVPPVGHLLRTAFPERWIRFHSLPDRKRYPEYDDEWQTVLYRHNSVLDHIAGIGEEVNAISTEASFDPSPPDPPTALRGSITPAYWQSVPLGKLDDNLDADTQWHLFISTITWQTGLFDTLLRRIAMWEDTNFLVCHHAFEWAFVPYDGGIDVIASSTASRDALKLRFQEWLSPLASGCWI